MNVPDLIEELFGRSIVEGDIVEAFSLDHPEFLARPYLNTSGKHLIVNGDFFTTDTVCRNAGRFERSLYRLAGEPIAYHNRLDVRESFRRRGLAKAHLRKVVKFYRANGVKRVFLQAVDWGPVVWPALGFSFRGQPWELTQSEFRTLYEADMGVSPGAIPDWPPALSLAYSPKGSDIGAKALRSAYIKAGERPITMILELEDERTVSFLRARGVL